MKLLHQLLLIAMVALLGCKKDQQANYSFNCKGFLRAFEAKSKGELIPILQRIVDEAGVVVVDQTQTEFDAARRLANLMNDCNCDFVVSDEFGSADTLPLTVELIITSTITGNKRYLDFSAPEGQLLRFYGIHE